MNKLFFEELLSVTVRIKNRLITSYYDLNVAIMVSDILYGVQIYEYPKNPSDINESFRIKYDNKTKNWYCAHPNKSPIKTELFVSEYQAKDFYQKFIKT